MMLCLSDPPLRDAALDVKEGSANVDGPVAAELPDPIATGARLRAEEYLEDKAAREDASLLAWTQLGPADTVVAAFAAARPCWFCVGKGMLFFPL